MKERLLEFLKAENKSSAQFAEEIGVQPSGISHILSGRNNPSLDFVLKMLEKYRFLSTDWLLFGKGPMYKDSRMQTLFEENAFQTQEIGTNAIQDESANQEKTLQSTDKTFPASDTKVKQSSKSSVIERIVWFYTDKSFDEFFPNH